MKIEIKEVHTSTMMGTLQQGWRDNRGYHLGFNCTHSHAFMDEEGDIICPGCLEGAGMNDRDIDTILEHHHDNDGEYEFER